MKKMISLALVLILLMGMMVGAQAEETGKVVVSEAEAAPGENVEITISLQNVTLLCHAAVELVYDENVLEWIDVEPVDYSSANGRVQMSTGVVVQPEQDGQERGLRRRVCEADLQGEGGRADW